MAQTEIMSAIDRDVPAAVWDIEDVEWGLIVGYDTQCLRYHTLNHRGEPSSLHFDKLGRHGIDILSVVIPGSRNQHTGSEILRRSLETVIRHAEQMERMDRPKYQDGLPAFDTWALICERCAALVDEGRIHNVTAHIPLAAAYYADHYYGARCYARDYLRQNAGDNKHLGEAADCFAEVAKHLKPVWEFFRESNLDDALTMRCAARHIREAKESERRGIMSIQRYLDDTGDVIFINKTQ